jgi:hypothetical protein
MYEGAGLGPKDVDIFNPYDVYAPMAQCFLEAFRWHGVKRGDAFAFCAGDIRVRGRTLAPVPIILPAAFSDTSRRAGRGQACRHRDRHRTLVAYRRINLLKLDVHATIDARNR